MPNLVCADVRQWLQQAVLSNDLMQPEPALCEHVATCPLCQGALAVLAVEALGLTAPPDDINCQQSGEELAAFIEQEAEEGIVAAIRAYPHIWWHLWTCEVCAETYQVTRSLLTVEQLDMPVVRPMPATLFGPVKRRQPTLRLPRHFLFRAFAASIPAIGTLRGGTDLSYVLAEEESPEQHLTLSIQRQANDMWRINVSIKPPPVGWLILTLGQAHFRARFDLQGEAIFQDIPFALLTASDGPDLDLDIEPETSTTAQS